MKQLKFCTLAFCITLIATLSKAQTASPQKPINILKFPGVLEKMQTRSISLIQSKSEASRSGTEDRKAFLMREEVKMRLKNLIQLGTESSGGGAEDRKAFYLPIGKALKALSLQKVYSFDEGSAVIDQELLVLALRAVTLKPVQDQLYDRKQLPVDFYNDPVEFSISYNINRWQSLSEEEQFQYGLHELLGILTIPDPYYKISTALAKRAFDIVSSHQGLPSLVQSSEYMTEGLNPILVLKRLKQRGASVVISAQCERYTKNAEEFCIIATTWKDGVSFEEVLILSEYFNQFRYFR